MKQGVDLNNLPLKVLRNLDIDTPEEERMVQGIVNKKLAGLPPEHTVINRALDRTDFRTKEEELEFQKVIDERLARSRPAVGAIAASEVEIKMESKVQTAPEASEIATESELVAKIKKLKKQKEKLN